MKTFGSSPVVAGISRISSSTREKLGKSRGPSASDMVGRECFDSDVPSVEDGRGQLEESRVTEAERGEGGAVVVGVGEDVEGKARLGRWTEHEKDLTQLSYFHLSLTPRHLLANSPSGFALASWVVDNSERAVLSIFR